MGARSGAGIVVGVLTGSGTKKQLLENGANVVFPNIGYLKDLLLLGAEPSRPFDDLDVYMSIDD